MASLRARLATFLIKRVVKAPFVRMPTVATIRRVFNAAASPVPRGCTTLQENIGNVRVEVMSCDRVPSCGVMLYLHGGAYVACSPATHRRITGAFAKKGWQVFVPDYRLAPEYRYPAQIEDALTVYRSLLDRGIDPKKLVVAGESAGGNLTLALCLSLRALSLPQPRAIALFSPVTDFAWTGESSTSNSDRCAMFSNKVLPVGAEMYLGSHDPRDPLASPIYADLKGLPPMLLHVGQDEILRDDSVRLANHAQRDGVHAELKVWPVVPHAWQLLHNFIPEGAESLQLANDFLRRYLPA